LSRDTMHMPRSLLVFGAWLAAFLMLRTTFSGSASWAVPAQGNPQTAGNTSRRLQGAPTKSVTTCRFTIDNEVRGVYFDGADITNTVSGSLLDWGSVKTVRIEGYKGRLLEIRGYESADCNGCTCSGLQFECDNGFTSSIAKWTAYGSATDTEPSDDAFTRPCESTSWFFLAGSTKKPTKIWASNGAKYARFRAAPFGEEATATTTVTTTTSATTTMTRTSTTSMTSTTKTASTTYTSVGVGACLDSYGRYSPYCQKQVGSKVCEQMCSSNSGCIGYRTDVRWGGNWCMLHLRSADSPAGWSCYHQSHSLQIARSATHDHGAFCFRKEVSELR